MNLKRKCLFLLLLALVFLPSANANPDQMFVNQQTFSKGDFLEIYGGLAVPNSEENYTLGLYLVGNSGEYVIKSFEVSTELADFYELNQNESIKYELDLVPGNYFVEARLLKNEQEIKAMILEIEIKKPSNLNYLDAFLILAVIFFAVLLFKPIKRKRLYK